MGQSGQTRPHMFAAKLHSNRLQSPTTQDAKSLKHTLRYINGTQDYKLFIGKGLADDLLTVNGTITRPQQKVSLELHCYTTSDWAGHKHYKERHDRLDMFATQQSPFLRQQNTR